MPQAKQHSQTALIRAAFYPLWAAITPLSATQKHEKATVLAKEHTAGGEMTKIEREKKGAQKKSKVCYWPLIQLILCRLLLSFLWTKQHGQVKTVANW